MKKTLSTVAVAFLIQSVLALTPSFAQLKAPIRFADSQSKPVPIKTVKPNIPPKRPTPQPLPPTSLGYLECVNIPNWGVVYIHYNGCSGQAVNYTYQQGTNCMAADAKWVIGLSPAKQFFCKLKNVL